MAEKLYNSNELELVPFLRDSESWVTGDELLNRSAQLGAVEGEEQAEYLWGNRGDFPEEWKSYYLVVPEHDARRLRVFRWIMAVGYWFRYRDYPGGHFRGSCRLLRPRE